MSVMNGRAVKVEEGKYSSPDKPQWRVGLGGQFYTFYGSNPPPEGEMCAYEMKTSKAGNTYINSWSSEEVDAAPAPKPVGQVVQEAAPHIQPTPAETYTKKEHSICTQAIIKGLGMDPLEAVVRAREVLEAIYHPKIDAKQAIEEARNALESDAQAVAGDGDDFSDLESDVPF